MPRLGLIGGTGIDSWGEALRLHELSTPYGQPSTAIAEYQTGGLELLFLPRHGNKHEIPPHAVNYRANIDAFRQLDVNGLIAINAVGGISADNAPGSICVPDQLIDYTSGREQSFGMNNSDELVHAEFAYPFSNRIRLGLIRSALAAGLKLTEGGCIAVTQGPRLETAAEIQRFKRDGCDLVGMTSMPEAALAREAGLEYASLCVNANWAAGIMPEPISMEKIEATLEEAMVKVRKLLALFFEDFSNVH